MDHGAATKQRAYVLMAEIQDITQSMVKLEQMNANAAQHRKMEAWKAGYRACLRDGRAINDSEQQGTGG